MMRFSEQSQAGPYSRELADAVLGLILAALPGRACPSGQRAPFARETGDDWVADVGPAMSWEARVEYEELRFGTPASGVSIRYTRGYHVLMTGGPRDFRGDRVLIDAYGWAGGAELCCIVDDGVGVRWQLPDDEHAALLAAWEAFKAARGLTVRRPGTAERV
jgi:hypothetical protein